MSPTTLRRPNRAAVLTLCAALALSAWLLRPTPAGSADAPSAPGAAAIPASQRAGSLRLSGFSTVILPIRSFSIGAHVPAGGAKATFAEAQVALDAHAVSPAILRTTATGAHVPKLTVVLYHAGTTTRFQQWELEEVTFASTNTAKSGNAGDTHEQLAIRYAKITESIYASNGTTLQSKFCFNIAASQTC
ncbi:type VI secretion system tube protein Hcp [Nocardioides speluncae]|uniref:type VI secretion system tube protein Hcp n=1 Tax=Nocardioides speluncae TaxID=2670337 RepID=UPI000D68A0B4|nr:type VI secretion system tube protein Hcp [Nocardioides speluncae]